MEPAMPQSLRVCAPTPNHVDTGNSGIKKSGREKSPLVGGSCDRWFKGVSSTGRFSAPGRILPRLHADGEAHQTRRAAVLRASPSASSSVPGVLLGLVASGTMALPCPASPCSAFFAGWGVFITAPLLRGLRLPCPAPGRESALPRKPRQPLHGSAPVPAPAKRP